MVCKAKEWTLYVRPLVVRPRTCVLPLKHARKPTYMHASIMLYMLRAPACVHAVSGAAACIDMISMLRAYIRTYATYVYTYVYT